VLKKTAIKLNLIARSIFFRSLIFIIVKPQVLIHKPKKNVNKIV